MTIPLAHATITPVTGDDGRTDDDAPGLTVQFNPETLEITSRSKLQEEKGEQQDKAPVQVVSGTERSLVVQLIFDETTEGHDVRNETSKIVALMQSGDAVLQDYGRNNTDKAVKVPKLAVFSWGNLAFRGVISECTETLEYFSAEGVPLRASVKFTMQERNAAFSAEQGDSAASPAGGGMALPPETPLPPGGEVGDLARQNGIENRRAPETDEVFELTVNVDAEEGGSVRGSLGNFSSSASVSSKNSSVNASASSGARAQRSASNASGAVQFGLPSASIATGQVGLDAGLGVPADAGGSLGLDAFAELKPPKLSTGAKLDSGVSALAELSAGFGGKGSAQGEASALFTAKAEVGASVDLGALLFGEDDH